MLAKLWLFLKVYAVYSKLVQLGLKALLIFSRERVQLFLPQQATPSPYSRSVPDYGGFYALPGAVCLKLSERPFFCFRYPFRAFP